MAAATSRGVAANFEADPDGPPRGTMLKGPWRDLDERLQEGLAPRRGGPGDRPPLEEPAADLVARRGMGGRGHRAPGPLPQVGLVAPPGPSLSLTCGA